MQNYVGCVESDYIIKTKHSPVNINLLKIMIYIKQKLLARKLDV